MYMLYNAVPLKIFSTITHDLDKICTVMFYAISVKFSAGKLMCEI